jgi:hypothetical protein
MSSKLIPKKSEELTHNKSTEEIIIKRDNSLANFLPKESFNDLSRRTSLKTITRKTKRSTSLHIIEIKDEEKAKTDKKPSNKDFSKYLNIYRFFKSVSKSDKFRIFEVVSDGNMAKFNYYKQMYSLRSDKNNVTLNFLRLRDPRNRSLVHTAAYRGSVDILKDLLQMFAKKRTKNVRAFSLDKNGDSALDLACIRGFDHVFDETYTVEGKDEITSKRYQCVKMLLEYRNKDGEKEFKIEFRHLRKNLNSPLHWSIYWADLHLAYLLFHECRDQIFWTNRNDLIPFDMCFLAKTKFLEKKARLVSRPNLLIR